MSQWLRARIRAVAAAALALLCACIGVVLLDPSARPGATSGLTRASYDACFRWFLPGARAPVDSAVVIVYLDLESYLREGQDPLRPWPRELHTRLLDRLTSAGARAVVFDIIFDSRSGDLEADERFAQAMYSHGGVVLAGELGFSSQSIDDGPWGRTKRLSPPDDLFVAASRAWGLGEIAVDDDFVARRHYAGDEVPSLTWAAARMLEWPSVADTHRHDRRWLRYYGPPYSLPHVGYSQALDPTAVDDSAFRDKVVFVGARPMAGLFEERRDEFRSPFRSWRDPDRFTPGVEVHATQMLNLLRSDWLGRLDSSVEITGVAIVGVLLGAGMVFLRPVQATMVSLLGAVAFGGTAAVLFRQYNLWIPWLVVVAAQLPAALGGSVLFQSLEWLRTRRRLEASKRESEARIREQAALIDKARDAIFVQSIDGRIVYANPSAARIYEWLVDELTAGAADSLFSDAAAKVARETALREGEWSGELRHGTRGGRAIIVESRWTLLRDEDRKPKELLVINSDVTEKKQLEAESLRMQRMEAVGALAGGMAHDLNNALAPVLMGTQLLRRETGDDEPRRILSLMESSTRRGADMVRQVLLFARGRRAGFEQIDVRPLVKEVGKLAQDTFPRNIVVTSDVADDVWPIRGDATQLHQILLNLCVNARDAMPEGGSLSLAADNAIVGLEQAAAIAGGSEGDFVVLMVGDTGEGIRSDLLPKIFDAFFTTKPEGKGTGLGLSTTVRITKAHGGFINVQSVAGEGTTFEVYLPRFVEAEVPQAGECLESVAHGNGELILVADDDKTVRELLRVCLEEHGYRVALAGDGAEAVSLFRRLNAEIATVLCDRAMPVLDGPKAVTEIRRIRSGVPVIMLSGEDIPEESSSVGILHLSKPVAMDVLLNAIRTTV